MSGEGNRDMRNDRGEDNSCRDYQRGVCHRGNKCKFTHPEDVKPPAHERLPICRDFQNGSCGRNKCKYMHVTSQEERIYMKTGQLPQSNSGGRQMNSSMPSNDQVCKDYLNNICNRGNTCKFRHVSEEEYQRQKGSRGSGDSGRKRRRDDYGSSPTMDSQFLQEENDMLRRKVADLQRQVADLRTMNDTLYEQNTRYRQMQSPMESGGGRGGSNYNSSYSRDSYNSGPSRDGYDNYP